MCALLRFEHPDSYRFAEALEVGCLPLIGACEEAGESNTNSNADVDENSALQRASINHGAYFRAYAAYAETAFGAPPMGSLRCGYADLENQSWGCPSVPAALLWHADGGGRKTDWPLLASVAADTLKDLRGDATRFEMAYSLRSTYFSEQDAQCMQIRLAHFLLWILHLASIDLHACVCTFLPCKFTNSDGDRGRGEEEDPLITVQRDLVTWWRGLKKSLAHEIGRRLTEIMA